MVSTGVERQTRPSAEAVPAVQWAEQTPPRAGAAGTTPLSPPPGVGSQCWLLGRLREPPGEQPCPFSSPLSPSSSNSARCGVWCSLSISVSLQFVDAEMESQEWSLTAQGAVRAGGGFAPQAPLPSSHPRALTEDRPSPQGLLWLLALQLDPDPGPILSLHRGQGCRTRTSCPLWLAFRIGAPASHGAGGLETPLPLTEGTAG